MNLSSMNIVVAGAGGRIGQALVEHLLQAGARVLAADRSPEVLLKTRALDITGERLSTEVLDISDARAVRALLDGLHESWGGVDGAINTAYPRNASYGRHFLDVTYEDFSENLGLHLGGYFIFMQQCAAYSIDKAKPFSLVNLSSVYGHIAPRFDLYEGTSMTMPVEYAAIKAGLNHITRYANAVTKGSGFRSNCVSPGGILDAQPETFLKRYQSHCAEKGMLDAADVTGACLFLLSKEGRYVRGQNLIVDDGFTV